MIKLSIITVCKNEETNIERTLTSVLEQTFTDYEYVVIDGGSTDGTMDIVNKYSDRINIIVSEPDTGIFNAQMKGLKYSSGEYIYFLNAGDYLSGKSILEKVFLSAKSSDIVYGDIIYKLKNGMLYRKKSFKIISPMKLMLESLPHPATFTKRSVFDKCGKFDESYKIIADYEFLLRALLKFRCSTQYISIPLAVFNLEGLSSKSENTLSYKHELDKAQREYVPKLSYRIFRIFKPLILLIFKKFRYLLYLTSSIISKKFLLGE